MKTQIQTTGILKNKIRSLLLPFLLILSSVNFSHAQRSCPAVNPAVYPVQPVSQPSNCIQLLKDFIPHINEPTLDINVYFWVFAPTSNSLSGAWTNSLHPMSDSLLQICLDQTNTIFSNIPATPQLTVAGAGSLTHAKIRTVLKGWQIVHDDFAYRNTAFSTTVLASIWNDPNAINIYLGTQSISVTYTSPTTHTVVEEQDRIYAGAVPGVYPENFIAMTPAFFKAGTFPFYYEFIEKYNLAHEVGHILGLYHTDAAYTFTDPITTQTMHVPGSPSFISPTFGCCSYIECSDVFMEPPGGFSNCNTPGASDNIMSGNAGCNRYLSPQQIAIMHFNLRTSLKDFLTPASLIAATTANPAFNYTLASSEFWTTDRHFKGNVIVPPGTNLTIKCVVDMQNQGKIIIRRGPNVPNSAKVTIDGGKVTNISGRLWEGFDVEGNPGVSQSGLNLWTNHGQLWLINGGTIENSICGVRNYGHNPDGSQNQNATGGIIYASGGRFINNVRDIEFRPHINDPSSFSQFHDCEFKTTGKINDNNGPYVHVSLCRVKGVKFRGCIFENAAQSLYPNGGQGVHSIDATYAFESSTSKTCYFKGFNQGISVGNFNPLWAINVSDAQFNDNRIGIELSSMQSAMITGNSFTLVTDSAKGVALNKCDLYSVSNNTFTGVGNWQGKGRVGVYATNSGQGAHRIYRNDFSNLKVGICPQFDNSGLTNISDGLFMNCNTFTSSANFKDIAMLGFGYQSIPTVARDQGVSTSPADPKKLVRNQYGAACYTAGHAKWYVYYSSTKTINHANNIDAVTTLTPQPNCSTTGVIIPMSSSSPFNFSSHCNSNGARPIINPSCPCPTCCRYTDISHGVSAVLAITNTLSSYVLSTIDGGNTQDLLDTINAGTLSSGQLKDLLLPFSPYLSDTILKAFLDKADEVAAAAGENETNIALVHNANKPFSPAVWELATVLGYNDELADQQADQPISARESLEGELNLARADLQFLYSEKINYFLHDTLDGAQDTVIRLLAENLGGIPYTVPRLVNAYARAGYYDRAFAYADSLSADPQYTELMAIETAKLKLDTATKGMYKLLDNVTLMSFFENYANDSTKAGSMAARAVLHEVMGRPMNFVYLLPEEEEGTDERRTTSENTENNGILYNKLNDQPFFKIYPNPANQNVIIYYTGVSDKALSYVIRDVLGREFTRGQIYSGTESQVKIEDFSNGIYFITLVKDNKVLDKKKLLIMK